MKNSQLRQYYLKYKSVILPATFLFLTIFILFRVIVPQLSSIGDASQAISDKNKEISTLQSSLSIVQSQNQDTLNSDLEIANHAVPTSKDISLIFTALSSAASSAQIELKEFSLKVGGVYGRAAKVSGGVKGVPSVDVVVRVDSSDATNIIKFAKEVQQILPLSEVKTIDDTGESATFDIAFYYKPSDLTLVLKGDNVSSLTQADSNLLEQLKAWNK